MPVEERGAHVAPRKMLVLADRGVVVLFAFIIDWFAVEGGGGTGVVDAS